jgi:hypothetical protein
MIMTPLQTILCASLASPNLSQEILNISPLILVCTHQMENGWTNFNENFYGCRAAEKNTKFILFNLAHSII